MSKKHVNLLAGGGPNEGWRQEQMMRDEVSKSGLASRQSRFLPEGSALIAHLVSSMHLQEDD